MVVISARDIACAAGTRPAAVECLMHSCQHDWMLSHSKIVVRTPDRHLLFPKAEWSIARGKSCLPCVPDRRRSCTDLPYAVHRVACRNTRHNSWCTWSWNRCRFNLANTRAYSWPMLFGPTVGAKLPNRHGNPARVCRLLLHCSDFAEIAQCQRAEPPNARCRQPPPNRTQQNNYSRPKRGTELPTPSLRAGQYDRGALSPRRMPWRPLSLPSMIGVSTALGEEC